LSVGEVIATISFFIGIITFLFKNYYSFQSNTEAIKNLNNTIKEMNRLINKISEKQELSDDRILKLEEQTKSLWNNHKDVASRIRELEKGRGA